MILELNLFKVFMSVVSVLFLFMFLDSFTAFNSYRYMSLVVLLMFYLWYLYVIELLLFLLKKGMGLLNLYVFFLMVSDCSIKVRFVLVFSAESC